MAVLNERIYKVYWPLIFWKAEYVTCDDRRILSEIADIMAKRHPLGRPRYKEVPYYRGAIGCSYGWLYNLKHGIDEN